MTHQPFDAIVRPKHVPKDKAVAKRLISRTVQSIEAMSSLVGRSFVSIRAKLEGAQDFKAQGNALYKAGEFKKAVLAYRKVLAFTRGLPGSRRMSGTGRVTEDSSLQDMISQRDNQGPPENRVTADEEEIAMEIEAQSLTNIAMCYLRLDKAQQAQESAKKALLLRPFSWKAQMRLAEAQLMSKEFDEAKASFLRAHELAPESEVAAKNNMVLSLNSIKALKKAWEDEMRSTTAAAFGRAFGSVGSAGEEKMDEA